MKIARRTERSGTEGAVTVSRETNKYAQEDNRFYSFSYESRMNCSDEVLDSNQGYPIYEFQIEFNGGVSVTYTYRQGRYRGRLMKLKKFWFRLY